MAGKRPLVVLFDLGGVLLDSNSQILFRTLEKTLGLPGWVIKGSRSGDGGPPCPSDSLSVSLPTTSLAMRVLRPPAVTVQNLISASAVGLINITCGAFSMYFKAWKKSFAVDRWRSTFTAYTQWVFERIYSKAPSVRH